MTIFKPMLILDNKKYNKLVNTNKYIYIYIRNP